jgi:hypothetical protein
LVQNVESANAFQYQFIPRIGICKTGQRRECMQKIPIAAYRLLERDCNDHR